MGAANVFLFAKILILFSRTRKLKSVTHLFSDVLAVVIVWQYCPTAAIEIYGRTISPNDLFELPDIENSAGYNQLMALYERRRSIREFRDIKVEPEIIEKILSAAKTAPMGLPPSDVNVLILDSRETTRLFARDFCSILDKMQWFVSKWFLL